MFNRGRDARIRGAAFAWLRARSIEHGDVIPRQVLAKGFEFAGERVPLIAPQGIFKPKVMELPLSITTAPNGPYNDAFGPKLLRYKYRGSDRQHRDNRGLRTAMSEALPLVYLHGVLPGRYVAMWPVFIVGDDPGTLTFSVAVDDEAHVRFSETGIIHGELSDIRREYVTTTARRRLHQSAFRERVLAAYLHRCALCRLRHEELLDAAHIIPDSEADGEPVVSNGMSLCRLHHSAFDRFFIGIRPDYTIQVRSDLLAEEDGPTLRYAIQALHGQRITVPRRVVHRPSVILLEERYERFRERAVE